MIITPDVDSVIQRIALATLERWKKYGSPPSYEQLLAEAQRPCTMGVGCDEVGVCFAEAHNQPEQCPKAQGIETQRAETAGLGAKHESPVAKPCAQPSDALPKDDEGMVEALTPSAETKAAYMGEFSFDVTHVTEDGDEVPVKTYVPWTTIKEIMAAIHKRALSPLANGEAMRRMWRPITELEDIYQQPIWIASPKLIHGDSNPLGIAEAYWQDTEGPQEGEWRTTSFDMCNDEWDTISLAKEDVTHFLIPQGPWSLPEAEQLELADFAPALSSIRESIRG